MVFRAACIAVALGSGIFLLSGCSEKDGTFCVGDSCACEAPLVGEHVKLTTMPPFTFTPAAAMKYGNVIIDNITTKKGNASIDSGCCTAARKQLQATFNDKKAKKTDSTDVCKHCSDSPSHEIKEVLKTNDCSTKKMRSSGFETYQAEEENKIETSADCSFHLDKTDAANLLPLLGVPLDNVDIWWVFYNMSSGHESGCCKALEGAITSDKKVADKKDICAKCGSETKNAEVVNMYTKLCTKTLTGVVEV